MYLFLGKAGVKPNAATRHLPSDTKATKNIGDGMEKDWAPLITNQESDDEDICPFNDINRNDIGLLNYPELQGLLEIHKRLESTETLAHGIPWEYLGEYKRRPFRDMEDSIGFEALKKKHGGITYE